MRRPEVETGSREARTDVEVEEAAVLRRERVVGAVAEAIWRCLWMFLSVNFVREVGWTKRRRGGDGGLYGWEMRLSLSLSLSDLWRERK